MKSYEAIIVSKVDNLVNIGVQFNDSLFIKKFDEYYIINSDYIEDLYSLYVFIEQELNASCKVLLYTNDGVFESNILNFLEKCVNGVYYLDDYIWYCLTHNYNSNYITVLETQIINLDSDLLKTLVMYIKNDGNATKTAKSMYLHRNTLDYRLRNLNEYFGLNLKSKYSLMILSFLTSKLDLMYI